MMKTDRSEYMKAYRAQYKQRVRIVKLSVKKPVFAKLEKLAGEEGKPPATVALELLEAGLDGDRRIPVSVRTELQTLRFLVRNIAGNINQMAHHSNTVRRVVEEGSLFDELKKMERHIWDFTQGRLNRTNDHKINGA